MCFVSVLPDSLTGHRIVHSQEWAFSKGAICWEAQAAEAPLAVCSSSVPSLLQAALTFRHGHGRGRWQCGIRHHPRWWLECVGSLPSLQSGERRRTGLQNSLRKDVPGIITPPSVWHGLMRFSPPLQTGSPPKHLRVTENSSFIGLFIPKTHSKAQGLDYKRLNHFEFA